MEVQLANKERDELKAARKRTQARFEALVKVGSEVDGNDGSSDVYIRKPQRKKVRSKTADINFSKVKKSTELSRLKSQSQEHLIKAIQKDSSEPEVHYEKLAGDKRLKKEKRKKPRKTGEDESNNGKDKNRKISNEKSNADGSVPNKTNESNVEKRKNSTKVRKKKNANTTERIINALNKKKQDDGLLFCIIIHKTDELRPDFRIRHPVIRIHIVNMNSGHYIKKTDPMRKVLTLYENENVDYILPVLTQPYDIAKNRCLTPQWNETVLYNEIFSYFLQREPNDPPVILFFELLDFALMTTKLKDLSKTDHGWHRLAWAFLKIVSPSGITNTGRKLRLQFYQPISKTKVASKDDNKSVDVYDWWKFGVLTKYPSTLYITIKGVQPPKQLNPTTRSMFPLQREQASITFEELNSTLDSRTGVNDHTTKEFSWTKLPGQINKIPNHLFLKLHSSKKGCSVVKFSRNGKYLACGCAAMDGFSLLIYEFPDGILVASFENHFGIVYDLCWSENDAELLSSSADCTVRCWDTKRYLTSSIKLLPHPSFVYCAQYHPKLQRIIVTGSFDKVIRLWDKMSESPHATLLREFDIHKSHVNALVFSINGDIFFSADGDGMIIEWNCCSESKKKNDPALIVSQWKLRKAIELNELKKTVIDTIHLHPNQQKLLIQSRDSLLRMLDLRSYGIQKIYSSGYNFKEHIQATMSSCGSYIFCGTENGVANVWSTETGQLLHTYNDLGYLKTVSACHFHPHDNYIVFCSYGESQPILIYSYDPKVQFEIQQLPKPFHNVELIETQKRAKDISDQSIKIQETLNSSFGMNKSRIEKAFETLNMVTNKPNEDRKTVTFKTDELSPRDTIQNPTLSTWGSDFSYSPEGLQSTKITASTPQIFSSVKRNLNRSSLIQATGSLLKKAKTVVSLYEYEPTRADELAFQPNEIITVLSEESSNWWIGQLSDGRKGYFPANYVMDTSHFHTNEDDKDDNLKDYVAAVNRKGDLKIISSIKSSNQMNLNKLQKKHQLSNKDSIA
ncbi:jouberin isoform X3 [Hydra vulgaris]|uniref:Jouberin isoform X3 n=1 Tax=Hydra vulgaris TaxID=6087 RepID=A0ABM4DEP7_HYDVU